MSETPIYFYRIGSVPIIKTFKFIYGKTVRKIIKKLGFEKVSLAIRTPRCIVPMSKEAILSDLFPDIGQPSNFSNGSPLLSIQISNKADKDNFYIFVNPFIEDFPSSKPFLVDFTLQLWENNTARQIIDRVSEQFGLSNCSPMLYIGTDEVQSSMEASAFFIEALTRPISFTCQLLPGSPELCAHRMHNLKEILETEITFTQSLTMLNGYFRPAMQAAQLVSQKNIDLIFDEIPNILMAHLQLMTDLEEAGMGYDSSVGNAFIDFASQPLAVATFMKNFKKISKVAASLTDDATMRMIVEDNPEHTNLSLSSYLMTIIQRPPRYRLLLQELIKHTPTSHPDYRNLQIAMTKINDYTSQFDQLTDYRERMQPVIALKKKLRSNLPLLDQVNSLVSQTEIVITTKISRGKGTLYMFDNALLITSTTDEVERYEFLAPLEETHFMAAAPNIKGVVFQKQSGDIYSGEPFDYVSVEFSDSYSRLDWLSRFVQFRMPIIVQKLEAVAAIWTEVLTPQRMPPFMFDHDSVYFDKSIISVGGANFMDNRIRHDLIIFTVEPRVSFMSVPQLSLNREGASLATCDDKLFCFGGIRGKHSSNSMHYYVVGEQWKQIKHPEAQQGSSFDAPAARAYHTMCNYNGIFVIFAGADGSQYFNDVVLFDAHNNIYSRPKIKSTDVPEPRKYHSACIYQNLMLVHGGRAKKVTFSDLWAFNFVDGTWNKIDISLPPRAEHRAVVVGHHMIIIGGKNSNGAAPMMDIDLSTWKAQPIKCGGNVSEGICKFSATLMPNHDIILYGGVLLTVNQTINSLTRIVLPPKLAVRDATPVGDVQPSKVVSEAKKAKRVVHQPGILGEAQQKIMAAVTLGFDPVPPITPLQRLEPRVKATQSMAVPDVKKAHSTISASRADLVAQLNSRFSHPAAFVPADK